MENTTSASGFGAQKEEREEYVPQLSLLEEEYMAKAMIRQKEGVVKP
jgi:hypothetical protein